MKWDKAFLAVAAAGLAFRLALSALPPLTDVHYYDVQAAQALLSGLDPYGHLYTGIPVALATPGAANVFAYFPLVAVLLAPFQLAGDAVLGLVAADIAIAVSLRSLGGRWGTYASSVYLLLPATVIFSTIFPNNALVAATLVALAVAAEKSGRGVLAAVLVGLAAASSQFVLLLLPLFFALYLREGRPRSVAASGAAAAIAVLPFYAWNPSSFVNDALLFEFSRTPTPLVSLGAYGYNLNPTLSGAYASLTGAELPLELRLGVVLVLMVYFLARSKDLPSLLLNSSLFMVATVLVLPQVFFWIYLELPFVTLLLWFVLTKA